MGTAKLIPDPGVLPDDSVQDPEVDWGSGTDQVDLDDVPDGTTYSKVKGTSLSSNEVTKLTDGSGDDLTTSLGGSDRVLTMSGNATLNQDVSSAGSPAFAGATVGALGGVIKASAGVLAGSSDADDLSDGATNAMVTLVQEGNWDTHIGGDGSDHTDVATNTTHSGGNGSDHADVATNTTHSGGNGSDHANVATNTTHSSGDGSDHADVATNTTHSGGDGSDHADVATNTTHSSGNGSDHANVATNTTHISSNGSDHTYIDQDVTTSSNPSFGNVDVNQLIISS